MLSFFLSNLSFYIVEGLSSRSSETVYRQPACHGLSAEMASGAVKTARTRFGVIESVERRYRGYGLGLALENSASAPFTSRVKRQKRCL